MCSVYVQCFTVHVDKNNSPHTFCVLIICSKRKYVYNFKYANDLLEAGGVCKTLWPQKEQYEQRMQYEVKKNITT